MYGRTTKYGNRKVVVDDRVFDSGAEAHRYQELKLLEQAGEISQLTCQPKFILQEGFRDFQGSSERAITYTADFSYYERGIHVVEDVKSPATRADKAYRLKVKLFKKRFPGIEFREVGFSTSPG